ncbi:MAG TPA: hypothetical protein VN678_09185 [Acidobacteriaceae bacterium]|nr:hypothetical protein [Acidobacteriaceae bacterium]
MIRISTLALTFLVAACTFAAGQTATKSPMVAPDATPKPCPDCAARRKDWDAQSTRTFYLKYAVQPAEMNEISAVLRQMLPQDDKTFVIPEQAAIMVRAIPDDMPLAQKVIDDLDRPKKAWRLTYTITEMDGDKRLGSQHYTMDLVDGQRTDLQEGSRVPIATGSYSSGSSSTAVQTQFTYTDVGITFEATLSPQGSGARLLSSIEQSGVAEANAGAPPSAVITRHSSLKGSYLLGLGKPLVLGTMDMPGSTHHLEIEALIEPLP